MLLYVVNNNVVIKGNVSFPTKIFFELQQNNENQYILFVLVINFIKLDFQISI